MKRQAYQRPELRDANDSIIQEGTYGKTSPLVNSTNDGVLDYINNNLEALYDNTMGGTGGEINTETITGKTGTITNLTATTVKAGTLTADALNGPLTGDVTGNVTGDVTGNLTGNVTGNVTGDVTGNLTGDVTGTADKAVADAAGNNIQTTYAKKSDLKDVERVNASGSSYIRFESGIQICWGTLSIPAGTAGRDVSDTMTFPCPFANTNYVLTFGNDWLASSSEYLRAEGRNTGNFKFTAVGVNSNPHKALYVAIGYWK